MRHSNQLNERLRGRNLRGKRILVERVAVNRIAAVRQFVFGAVADERFDFVSPVHEFHNQVAAHESSATSDKHSWHATLLPSAGGVNMRQRRYGRLEESSPVGSRASSVAMRVSQSCGGAFGALKRSGPGRVRAHRVEREGDQCYPAILKLFSTEKTPGTVFA